MDGWWNQCSGKLPVLSCMFQTASFAWLKTTRSCCNGSRKKKWQTRPEEVLWKQGCCILMVKIALRLGFGCLQITKNALGQVLNVPRDFHLLFVRVDFIIVDFIIIDFIIIGFIIMSAASWFNGFNKQCQCVFGFLCNLVEVIQDPWLRPTWRHEKAANHAKYISRNMLKHPTVYPTLSPNLKSHWFTVYRLIADPPENSHKHRWIPIL